jgi:hypothetical protein
MTAATHAIPDRDRLTVTEALADSRVMTARQLRPCDGRCSSFTWRSGTSGPPR